MLAHAEFFRSLTLLSSPHLAYALGRSACSLTLSLLPLLHYSALLTSLILSYITLFADYSPPFRHCCCSHRASVWGICAAASPFGFGFDRRLGARAPSSCATRTHGQGQIAAAQSSTGRRGWFLRTRRWRSSPSLDLANTDGWKMAAAQSSTGRRGWFYRHPPTSLWQPLASRYTSETLKPVRTLSTTRTRPLKTSLGRPGIFNVLARSHFTRARTPMGGLTFVCVVGENPMGA